MSADQKCTPEMAQKVFYEFTMFKFLHNRLWLLAEESGAFLPGEIVQAGTSLLATDDKREVFAQLESYLLHARVLRDFFFRAPKYPDDVVASDFLPEWSTYCPSLGTYLNGQELRLNKALAHLSTERLKYDNKDKRWNVTAIHNELQPVIELFLTKLRADRRAWFNEPIDPDY